MGGLIIGLPPIGPCGLPGPPEPGPAPIGPPKLPLLVRAPMVCWCCWPGLPMPPCGGLWNDDEGPVGAGPGPGAAMG